MRQFWAEIQIDCQDYIVTTLAVLAFLYKIWEAMP